MDEIVSSGMYLQSSVPGRNEDRPVDPLVQLGELAVFLAESCCDRPVCYALVSVSKQSHMFGSPRPNAVAGKPFDRMLETSVFNVFRTLI